jgi:hypothetical protein
MIAARPLAVAVALAMLNGTAPADAVPPPAAGAARTSPGAVPPAVSPAPAPFAAGDDPNAEERSPGGPGPLVGNGFGSPACREPRLTSELSAAARGNCDASGISVAAAPLDHYQFDVHIDNGFTGLGHTLDTIVQDLVLTPLWTALLWLTHVALVALEWCYSIDLLAERTLGPIADGLRAAHRALSAPWLATVLAVAAIAFAYNGIMRRRVVETLGQFALMVAMMAGGLWVIVDPAATIGEADRLANEASLGTLAAAATGDPQRPLQSLDEGLQEVFQAAVTGPWCYLEFGDVAWCREPARLDRRLVDAAQRIALADRAAARCAGPSSGLVRCATRGSPAQRELVRAADALTRARSNGALFLALPANGRERNSINADGSLLRVLCGSTDASACTASTGPQAEFRTQKGTLARAGGLLLVAAGGAGMLALLAFLALRLLSTALLAVLYLLLAPVAVLAPALGDGGRAAFRLWSMRLIGTVLAKLLYSFYLGVVLLIVRVLSGLTALGWWTQWLLVAAFWWIAFQHRHRLLENVIRERPARQGSIGGRLFASRQALKLAAPGAHLARRMAGRNADALRGLPQHAGGLGLSRRRDNHGAELAEQPSRMLELEHTAALRSVAAAPAIERELDALRTRRERLAREHNRSADGRRRMSLALRAEQVAARLEAGERALAAARVAAPAGEEQRRRSGVVHTPEQRAARSELLDRQAALRPSRAPGGPRRDYGALAPLAGVAGDEYERLPEREQRRIRLAVDRELDLRSKWSAPRPRIAADRVREPPRPVTRRQRQFAPREP